MYPTLIPRCCKINFVDVSLSLRGQEYYLVSLAVHRKGYSNLTVGTHCVPMLKTKS